MIILGPLTYLKSVIILRSLTGVKVLALFLMPSSVAVSGPSAQIVPENKSNESFMVRIVEQ